MSEGWYGFEGDDEDDTPDTSKPAQVLSHQGTINGTVVKPTPPPPPVVEEIKELFINKYRHCGMEWEDAWTSSSNDECPCCGAEITPYESEKVEEVV